MMRLKFDKIKPNSREMRQNMQMQKSNYEIMQNWIGQTELVLCHST